MEQGVHRGIKKVLVKLENSIKNKNFYEAHQMYRTLYFRYLEQKRYLDLINLLYSGSLLFLRQEQHTSGADLGLLLIDVLKKSKIEVSDDYLDKIIDLLKLMNPGSPERDTFVQNAVRWSSYDINFSTGHPHLHKKIAQVYWNERNYNAARLHFLYSNDELSYATMLIELHTQQGYSTETGLFVAQIVLQLLCLHNITAANAVFKIYISKHPHTEKDPPFCYPLLNFLFFLLKSIEMKKQSLFTILCDRYLSSLNKDPCYLQYLDRIGQLFFNIQSSQNCNGGLLSSFLYSFFNGLGNEDNSENATAEGERLHISPELD